MKHLTKFQVITGMLKHSTKNHDNTFWSWFKIDSLIKALEIRRFNQFTRGL